MTEEGEPPEVDRRKLAASQTDANQPDTLPPSPAAFSCPDSFAGIVTPDVIDDADADQALDIALAAEKLIALAHATQLRALARFASLRPSEDPHRVVNEFAVDEIAPELRWTRHAAASRLALATTLTTRLPATLAALGRGEIDLSKARTIVDHTDPLTDEHAVAIQHAVLPRARRQT